MFSFYEQLTLIKWDKFLVVVVVSVTGLFMKNRNPFLIPINPASTKKVIHPSQISMSGRSITWQQFFVLGSHLNLQKWFLLCFTSYFISTLRLLEQFKCTCMRSKLKCYLILEYSRKDFSQIVHIWAWIFFCHCASVEMTPLSGPFHWHFTLFVRIYVTKKDVRCSIYFIFWFCVVFGCESIGSMKTVLMGYLTRIFLLGIIHWRMKNE